MEALRASFSTCSKSDLKVYVNNGCFPASALSTWVMVYVLDWLALRTSCPSTYVVVAFVNSNLKTVVA